LGGFSCPLACLRGKVGVFAMRGTSGGLGIFNSFGLGVFLGFLSRMPRGLGILTILLSSDYSHGKQIIKTPDSLPQTIQFMVPSLYSLTAR
jgi:hypothetical protein